MELAANAGFVQVEESPNTGKISLGLSVIVRVTLKDGTFHEVCAGILPWKEYS